LIGKLLQKQTLIKKDMCLNSVSLLLT